MVRIGVGINPTLVHRPRLTPASEGLVLTALWLGLEFSASLLSKGGKVFPILAVLELLVMLEVLGVLKVPTVLVVLEVLVMLKVLEVLRVPTVHARADKFPPP